MNKLYDHGEIDVPGIDRAGCAPGKQSEQRPKAFAPAADGIDDVTLDGWIECRGLLRNPRLNFFQMWLN
jgi:hypothetical protein